MELARAAALQDDRIEAENLYQHAEHYLRLMNALQHSPSSARGFVRPDHNRVTSSLDIGD
jgi:hypothetical protein